MQRYSPMEMLFYTYVAMFVILAPFILAQERDVFARIPHFTGRTWLGMVLLTFFHNYLSMVLFLKALKTLDVIQTALSNYLITFFGLPIAAIFLHERLTMVMIVGGVLVFGSTLLITVYEERRRVREVVPAAP
jgi:drug/metabolite transporter (DMT)-like permease